MSRNSDRLLSGVPVQTAGANVSGAEVTQHVEYIRQTIAVDLPSEGKFYPEGHPLHMREYVELKEMTAKEEDILMSRSLIQKGLVLDKLLDSLLITRVEPNTLLSGDKNALLIATRIAAYGADYKVQDVTCQYCLQAVKEHTFDLGKLKKTTLTDVLNSLKPFEPTEENPEPGINPLTDSVKFEDNLFYITVPKTKHVFGCKLLDGNDEERITRTLEARKKNNLGETNLIENMRAFVVSLDGETDRAKINAFLVSEYFPSSDSLFLRSTYGKLIPNVDLRQNYVCSNCGFEKEVAVPMTAGFFWPN